MSRQISSDFSKVVALRADLVECFSQNQGNARFTTSGVNRASRRRLRALRDCISLFLIIDFFLDTFGKTSCTFLKPVSLADIGIVHSDLIRWCFFEPAIRSDLRRTSADDKPTDDTEPTCLCNEHRFHHDTSLFLTGGLLHCCPA